MTTSSRRRAPHPAAGARAVVGAGTAITLIAIITGFQITAAVDARAVVDVPAPVQLRGMAVNVLEPAPSPSPAVDSSPKVAAASAPAPAAPAPAQPAPAPPAPAAPAPQPAPADGTTAGSGG